MSKPIWEEIKKIADSIPDTELAKMPRNQVRCSICGEINQLRHSDVQVALSHCEHCGESL